MGTQNFIHNCYLYGMPTTPFHNIMSIYPVRGRFRITGFLHIGAVLMAVFITFRNDKLELNLSSRTGTRELHGVYVDKCTSSDAPALC